MNLQHCNNIHLKDYEIKSPDFDYKEEQVNIQTQVGRFIQGNDGIWKNQNKKEESHATLLFLGDIMCQEKQMEAAACQGGFDYDYVFDFVRPLFKSADFVIGNLETPVCSFAPTRKERLVFERSWYNNAPVEFLKAVAYAGVDAVITANNHDLDTGAIGLGATLDSTRDFGLIATGTFKPKDPKFQMVNINGIKVAIVGFTVKHNGLLNNLTKEGQNTLVNTYSMPHAKALYNKAKKAGADLVFTYIHWGKEYTKKLVKTQVEYANELANIGYDAILGSHPHVLQEFDIIETKKKKVPIIYSLGNFVSHQSDGTKNLTIILKMKISHEGEAFKITCSYIPCRTIGKMYNKRYFVLPLVAKLGEKINPKIKDESLQIIKERIGNKLPKDDEVIPNILRKNLDWKEEIKASFPLDNHQNIVFQKYKEAISNLSFHNLESVDSFILKKEEDMYQVIGLSKLSKSFTIPSSYNKIPVTSIRAEAFIGLSTIKRVDFGKIQIIPQRVCKNCSNLEGIKMRKGTLILEEEAFSNCKTLRSVSLGLALEIIKAKAFMNCSELRSVKIGPSVKKIAKNAFLGCPKLTIYGLKDSYANRYANQMNIPFVSMPDIESDI